MKNNTKSFLLRGGAFILAAGIPVAAAASYYDFFVQRSETAVSAVAIVAIIIGLVSFKDTILRYFKTPSAFKIWLIMFIVAFVTSKIAEQFVVISAFGLLGQGLSMPLNMLSDKYNSKKIMEALKNGLTTN